MEARLCRGDEVAVVGAGNSAGQAIVYLSRYARTVHVIVRGDDLGTSMSRYLIDRVEHIDNVVIHRRAVVSAVEGNGHLTGISVRNGSGQETRLNTPALFMFIGADPNTNWLSGCIELDAKGFVLTDQQLPREIAENARWSAIGRTPFLLETSLPGVFAAGDVRSGSVGAARRRWARRDRGQLRAPAYREGALVDGQRLGLHARAEARPTHSAEGPTSARPSHSSPSSVGMSSDTVGWMYRALQEGRALSRTSSSDAMDRLVAAGPEHGGAENLLGFRVDDDLHQAVGLAFLERAANARHRPLADEHRVATASRLGLGHARAAERRVDVEPVGGDSVGHAATGAVEQVRRDDLEVVVGRVGERALPVAVAEGPDARHPCLEPIVHDDVAALIA